MAVLPSLVNYISQFGPGQKREKTVQILDTADTAVNTKLNLCFPTLGGISSPGTMTFSCTMKPPSPQNMFWISTPTTLQSRFKMEVGACRERRRWKSSISQLKVLALVELSSQIPPIISSDPVCYRISSIYFQVFQVYNLQQYFLRVGDNNSDRTMPGNCTLCDLHCLCHVFTCMCFNCPISFIPLKTWFSAKLYCMGVDSPLT